MADDEQDTATESEITDAEAADVEDAVEATTDEDAVEADAGGDDAVDADDPDDEAEEELPEPSEAKKKADAVIAARRAKDPSVEAAGGDAKVQRRVVTSRRVTPKAGAAKGKDDAPAATSKARDAKKTEQVIRSTPPTVDAVKLKGPSPWWVPALMFGLMIIGALVIMLNYMGAFGDPDNIRLVLGLVLILGGIVTATQYR